MKQKETHNLDEALRWALRQQADNTPLSQVHLEQMKRRIRQKEEKSMKGISFKKGLLVACALCVVGSITAVAASQLAGVEVHSNVNDMVSQYEEMETMAKDLYDVSLPETFANGYTFANAISGDATGTDAEGATLSNWETLMVTYTKEGGADLTLSLDPEAANTMVKTGQEETIDGITYYYNKIDYLLLPPEEELTAEELAQQEAGTLAIAYGSQTRQKQTLEQVFWVQDGISFQMFLMDGNLGQDDLMEMAKETAKQAVHAK